MRPTGESGRRNANILNTAAALVRALGSYVTVGRICHDHMVHSERLLPTSQSTTFYAGLENEKWLVVH